MTRPLADHSLVLGIHPTSRGFGWAAFSDPFTVHSHGICGATKEKNAVCLRKAGQLIDKLKPEILVLEAFDPESALRSKRIRQLCADLVSLAAEKDLEFHVYRRSDVRDAFRIVEARTRHEIAEAVARHVSGLVSLLPGRRKAWHGEDRRMSRFCAAALVLTHYHFEATQLFEDVRRAA